MNLKADILWLHHSIKAWHDLSPLVYRSMHSHFNQYTTLFELKLEYLIILMIVYSDEIPQII